MASSVQLRPEDQERVDRLVTQGRYASRDHFLHRAIDALALREERLADLDAQVREGRAQIAAGEGVDLEEAFDRLAARFADR